MIAITVACRPPARTAPAPRSSPTLAVAAAEPAPGLRLGEAVIPERYDAELVVDPRADRFRGAIAIDIALTRPTATVWLHARDLAIHEAYVESSSGKRAARANVSGDRLGLELGETLGAGRATLHLVYDGPIAQDESTGLFAERVGDDSYAYTQLEPTDARRVFPCFDEPGFKARWKLRLRLPKGLAALGNAPVATTVDAGEERVVTFEETAPLASYLVAFAVGPFDLVDAGVAGRARVPVRVATPRGRAGDAAYARSIAPQLLERIETYLEVPYPFAKLDLVAVPSMDGAMENAGLVTFDEGLLLSSPEGESRAFRQSTATVMAHELSHQWLGDLVTMRWWDDLWLNESLATWAAAKVVGEWQPSWGESLHAARETAAAMQADALASARSVRAPIRDAADAAMAFDEITYGKGASVLRSIERWIGPERFRAGLRGYVEGHRFGSARAEDLFSSLSLAAGRDVAPALASFVDRPGVPLVRTRLVCGSGAPRIAWSQERYRPLASAADAGAPWLVPFCARYGSHEGGEARSCALLEGSGGELTLDAKACPEWLVANDDASGYYHVAYDRPLLETFAKGALDHLASAEVAALLADLDAGAQAGAVAYGDVLPIVVAVARGGDARVVVDAARFVDGLRRAELVDDDTRPLYARFVRRTFGARATALGWVGGAPDDDARQLRRLLVPFVASDGEDGPLRDAAAKLAARYLAGNTEAIAPELATPLLVTAAGTGSPALLERLVEKLKETPAGTAHRRYLAALVGARGAWLAARGLQLVLDPAIDPRDAALILTNALERPTSRREAFAFLKRSFDAVAARLPRDSGGRIIAAAGAFCDEGDAREVESFFGSRAETIPGGARALGESLESIRLCAAQRAHGAKEVASFLRSASRVP